MFEIKDVDYMIFHIIDIFLFQEVAFFKLKTHLRVKKISQLLSL